MGDNVSQKNTSIWERIYAGGEAGSNLEYPCEDLVVAVNRYLSKLKSKGQKLLAIGFGSGNNLAFLARKGFDCYGIDVSSAAIEIARKRLSKEGLRAELKLITRENGYPFEDSFFDIVIAWHVLSYNNEESLLKALAEIRRVLKPGGVMLATFPTFQDFCITQGKKIARNTFELICEGTNQKGAIVVAAENVEAVRTIFSSFANLEIGYSEISVKGVTTSHWLIYGN